MLVVGDMKENLSSDIASMSFVGFKFFKVAVMKSFLFRGITPHSLVKVNHYFIGNVASNFRDEE
jgi:hypothetical protein